MEEIWCVTISQALPDNKRPKAKFTVEHFQSKETAEIYAESKEFEFKSEMEKRGFNFDKLDPDEYIFTSGIFIDWYYLDSYMDMPPFEIQVMKVVTRT